MIISPPSGTIIDSVLTAPSLRGYSPPDQPFSRIEPGFG